MYHFQVIYITSPNLAYIDDRAFGCLANVTGLLMGESDLLHPPPLHLISGSLESLQMSENNIEEISNDYFFGCKHLRRVSIIASQIRRVPTMNDTHTVLEFLIFSDNIIPDINQLYGVPIIKLKSLDLARNKIMVVEANLMIIPAIYYVELVENRLIVIHDLTQSGWGDALPDNRTVKN